MKKTLILIACLLIAVGTLQAEDVEKGKDKQIEELSKKAFRYSENNEKPSLTLITGYTGEAENQEWYREGYGKSCNNNVAMMSMPETALPIPGTSLVFAVLDCPAGNFGSPDSIIAFFYRNNTNVPVCFKRIKLMDDHKYYHYGIVGAISIRKSGEKGYYAVIRLSGGDGAASWSGLVFLFIDDSCNVTVLSKLYEELSYYEQEDGKSCHGKKIYYNFLNDHVVDVVTIYPCIDPTNEWSKKSQEKYDLKLLHENPSARTFKP
jgi:hypothetical protein